ncbi:sortase-associated OmpA-like protein PdsO [Alteromonas sediminis]|uniref:Sortase-associated OmpA-like protein PdsO n=1 Tax=Alteromonas sediminis TaxID=2259342 RepID=A0A3N5YEH4_9ALTE|nr:sortase-associated OmpA-like protein PdsO [Alteromonas sediminis]RPJ68145.1 sortase-associated OmpA-like protein PdsO [Alteromonas sediminis]
MKKQLIFSLSALALSLSTNALAKPTEKDVSDAKTNELIGFGSGATVGAAVGGPVGAMVGGIFGLLIADDVNDTKALKNSQNALAQQKDAMAQQHQELASLQSRYEKALADNAIQRVSLDQQVEKVMQEIASHVLFRTASSTIESHFKPQLSLVANGLKTNPELVVTLSGYADSRGDDSYNQGLSEQRALSVKQYLLSQGVDPKQVITTSFGESDPVSAQQNHEDHFFDRRVLVHVAQGQKAMTASNH